MCGKNNLLTLGKNIIGQSDTDIFVVKICLLKLIFDFSIICWSTNKIKKKKKKLHIKQHNFDPTFYSIDYFFCRVNIYNLRLIIIIVPFCNIKIQMKTPNKAKIKL